MSLTAVHPGPGLGSDASTAGGLSAAGGGAEARYCAWFHDLDAWTEYWDISTPVPRPVLLRRRSREARPAQRVHAPPRPPASVPDLARPGRRSGSPHRFRRCGAGPDVADAVLGVDDLLAELFERHFGDAADPGVREDYLEAVHRFATDTLPAAPQRLARVPDGEPRRRTAGRHTLDGDIMWFCWALHTEAAQLLDPDSRAARYRRPLMLAGVAAGCRPTSPGVATAAPARSTGPTTPPPPGCAGAVTVGPRTSTPPAARSTRCTGCASSGTTNSPDRRVTDRPR